MNDEFDENEFGDKFIRDARISREQEIRLKYIDLHLEKVKQMKSVQKMSESSSGLDQDEECVSKFESVLIKRLKFEISKIELKFMYLK